ISVGDQLAPIVGGAADAISGLAGAAADLPEPLLAAGTLLAGLSSAALLGGGALLLLLPRIAATKAAVDALGITAASTIRTLGKLGPAFAVAGGLLFTYS